MSEVVGGGEMRWRGRDGANSAAILASRFCGTPIDTDDYMYWHLYCWQKLSSLFCEGRDK